MRKAKQMAAMLGDPVDLSLAASRKGGTINAVLEVNVGPGFHIYSTDTVDGIPLTVGLPKGAGFQLKGSPVMPVSADGRLYGTVKVEIPITGKSNELEVLVGYQACDPMMCYMPVMGRSVKCEVS